MISRRIKAPPRVPPPTLSMFRGASEATGSSLRRWDAHSLIFQLTKLRHAPPQRLRDDAMRRGKENVCLKGCFPGTASEGKSAPKGRPSSRGSLGGGFMRPDGLSMFRGASEATGSSLRRWDAHSPIFQLTKLRHATPQRLRDDALRLGKANRRPKGRPSSGGPWVVPLCAPTDYLSSEAPPKPLDHL